MNEINIVFFNKYVALDNFCKDLLKSNEGISSYIYEMECVPFDITRKVPNWEECHKKLKRIRHIRNQLAHDGGAFELDLCSNADLVWIDSFRESIMKTKDPIAIAYRISSERSEQQRPMHYVQTNAASSVNDIRIENSNKTSNNKSLNMKTSIWKKFILKIKNKFKH